MTRTKQWKITLIVLCVVLALTLVATILLNVNLSGKAIAQAEDITVTIKNGGNGTVIVNDQTLEPDNTTGTIEVTLSEGDTLKVKSEGRTVTNDDASTTRYVFQYWSTGSAGGNGVSVKAEDTFSYDECSKFTSKTLYANFVQGIPEEEIEKGQITVNYEERLGDVYFFMGKKNPTQDEIVKHGVLITNGEPADIPFSYELRGSRGAYISASNVTILAIPKDSEVISTLDPSKTTSAVFENWTANYYSGTLQENKPLPEICGDGMWMSSDNPDGTKTWIPGTGHEAVGAMWQMDTLSGSSDDFLNVKPEQKWTSSQGTLWWTNPVNSNEQSAKTLSIQKNTITANFQEVACTPLITITPIVNDNQKENVVLQDAEQEAFIKMPYGSKNSITVVLAKQPDRENQTYNITLEKPGSNVVTPISTSEIMENVIGFTVSDIAENCTVVITPDYKDETYYVVPIEIHVEVYFEDGMHTMVSPDSETVTVPEDEQETKYPWKADAQYNSQEAFAFSSGLSFNEDFTRTKKDGISQLCFQVTGSGVFTFEFYLDGLSNGIGFSRGIAVYSLNTPVTSTNVKNAAFNSEAHVLADGGTIAGGSDVLTYGQSVIRDSSTVSRISGGDWCKATIRIDAGAEETTKIYIAHAVSEYLQGEQYIKVTTSHTAMAVRNVAFYQGKSNVSWGIYGDENGNKSGYGAITVTNGDAAVNAPTEFDSGTRLNFSVSYNDGSYRFYGWSDGAVLLSVEEEFSYTVKGKTDESSTTKIYAVIAPQDSPYYYRTDGQFFGKDELKNALTTTQSRGQASVFVLEDSEIAEDIEIPVGVSLIVPFENSDRISGSAANGDETSTEIAWAHGDENRYRLLTIKNGVTVTVRGGLYIGGVVNNKEHNYQGHTSGKYAEIDNQGKIIVEDGGMMDVYGRITGSGSITLNNGAKLYQPFLILDYSGGSNALGMFEGAYTPFKRYAMINIECSLTVNYGSTLYGHASLYALSEFFALDQPFISYDRGSGLGGDGKGNDTFVMLHKGASVTITYDPTKVINNSTASNGTAGIGKTTMIFEGGATFSYMLFSAMGISIPTNSVYFSIPYNFEVEMNAGSKSGDDVDGTYNEYDTKTDFMIMPGAVVKVGKNATLTLNANTYVYDGLVQGALSTKSYPTAQQLTGAGYSANGNLIVDGTLKIGQKMSVKPFDLNDVLSGSNKPFDSKLGPATFLGIVQTNGTGRIEIPHEDTILNGKIHDGINGTNYFAYTTSARVFDAAHGKEGVIAELQAGHTYTATGSDEFTLESLKYTNTKDGEEKLTLDLNQQLHGSWKVDHSDAHKFDWTPADTDAKPDDATKRQTLTRQCTELGCNATEQKDLLYKPESLGELTYNGKDVADADLQGLFEKLFGQGTATAQFSGYSAHNAQVEAYNVTVTLTNGYWLVGSEYQDSVQLTFKVNPKPITVKANDKNAVYGEAHALDSKAFTVLDDGLCANDVLSLRLQFQGAEPHDVGDYTIEITDYSGNTNYAITPQTGTYKVTQLAITVVLSAQERDYNGNVPLVSEIKSALKQGTLPYEDQLKDIITISFTGAVSKDANSYPFTATLTETGKKNYTLTVEGGSYVINKKQVTVTATDLTSVYGEGLQELAYKVEGLVGQETIDEYINIFTDATETSPVGKSYTITVTWKDSNRPTNYEVEFHNGHYTITNAQFGNITFSETTVTFDGKVHKPKMNNAPEGATVEYTLNKEPFDGAKDAGTYELTATVKLANYEDSQPYSVTFTINKLEITVALTSVTRSYNGKVPTIEELKATVNDKTVLDTGDNLADIVTVAFTSKVSEDVGDYTAKVSLTQAGEKNYTLKSETESVYKITQEQIAIAITPYTREYDGKDAATDGTLGKLQWSKTSGNWAADEAQPTITFSLEVSSAVNVGDYSVKGECSDSKNYNVTFTGKTNAVKITPCTLTVTAADKNSTYGDQPVALTYDVTGLVQGDGASPAIKVTCEVTKASGVKAEGYVITVEVTNENELRNYTVVKVNGKYTVDPKPVTVKIADQNDVFGYNKQYTVEPNWTVEGELANNEEKDVLQVTLSIPTITTAGTYAITGSYNNNNYTVTFEGSYEGTKGTYTVAKKTVEDNVDDTTFQALVNGEQWQADENYKLADGSLTFSCLVYVHEDSDKQLNVKYTCNDQKQVSELSFTEEGVYEITVEIDDVNYQGSATYSLEIVGADGRTQHLKDVLDALKERAGELTPETLTTTNECFETLNFIKQQVDSLSEDEQAMAEEDLAPYLELVEAWNNAVDEDVIATAQAIAQAPINGLMVIASLNAIVMAVYVIGKGGLLR